jgi:hypothetical protein
MRSAVTPNEGDILEQTSIIRPLNSLRFEDEPEEIPKQ